MDLKGTVMNTEDKARRLQRIKAMSEARAAKSQEPMIYWLTRNSYVDGILDPKVTVWLSRPRLVVRGEGVAWVCDEQEVLTGDGFSRARYSSWSLEECRRTVGTVPETARECIRVG